MEFITAIILQPNVRQTHWWGEYTLKDQENSLSFVQGHQQTYMIGCHSLSNGKRLRGLVQGACYLHDEDYRGFQSTMNGEEYSCSMRLKMAITH